MFMHRDFLDGSEEEEFSDDESMPPPLMNLVQQGKAQQQQQKPPQQVGTQNQTIQKNAQQQATTFTPLQQNIQQKKQINQADLEDSFEDKPQKVQKVKSPQTQPIRPQEVEYKPKENLIQSQKPQLEMEYKPKQFAVQSQKPQQEIEYKPKELAIQSQKPQQEIVASLDSMNIKYHDPDFVDIANSSNLKLKTQTNIQNQQKQSIIQRQQDRLKNIQQLASVTGVVSTHNERPSTASRKNNPLNEMLNSDKIPNEKDIAQNKQLSQLSGKIIGSYEPNSISIQQQLPAPLKSQPKILKAEVEKNEGRVVIEKKITAPIDLNAKEEEQEPQQVVKHQNKAKQPQKFQQQYQEEEEEEEQEEEEEDEEQKQMMLQQEQLKKQKAAKLEVLVNEPPQEPQLTKQEERAQNMQRLYEAMQDMRKFVMNPVPSGIMLQTTIRRDRSGLKRF